MLGKSPYFTSSLFLKNIAGERTRGFNEKLNLGESILLGKRERDEKEEA